MEGCKAPEVMQTQCRLCSGCGRSPPPNQCQLHSSSEPLRRRIGWVQRPPAAKLAETLQFYIEQALTNKPSIKMNRTFKALRATSSNDDAFELSLGERFDESGISWDELLKSQRILIVSEAGAGKTYECESKARELFARGEPAFFLSLERVESAGVVATLFGDEHERFTNWLASSSQLAYFFLDSIDELQLVHRSFKDALRRFANDIRGAMGRATVVVTARPVPIDRQAFRDILPVPTQVRHEDSQDEFIRIAMDGPSKTKDEGPPVSREVALLPLTVLLMIFILPSLLMPPPLAALLRLIVLPLRIIHALLMPKLAALGIKEYRQTAFKPYRVIYRVVGSQVVIYLIIDGRRDMQSALARRFFGA